MLELEGHAAVRAHVAAVLGKGVAHIGHGARPVIRQTVDHDCRAADAVAFVADFHVLDAFQLACAFFDRVFDLVLRHIAGLGLVDGQPQARVESGVAAAHLGGDGNLFGDLGKGGAALFILATLAVLDVGPFGMSGHAVFSDVQLRAMGLAYRRDALVD